MPTATTQLPAITPRLPLDAYRAAWDTPALRAEGGARLGRALAHYILKAPILTRVGDLIIASAGWAGPHRYALLSEDGRGFDTNLWCHHPVSDGFPWVRYERWAASGMVAHGSVCAECRKLTQSG